MNRTNAKSHVRHYSPNLVYVLSIDGKFYVGCHTANKEFLTENDIRDSSGNPLRAEYRDHKILNEEYQERTQVIRIEECKAAAEALDLEVQMIKEYKDLFGDDCINKALFGNSHGIKGLHITVSQEKREKLRNKSTGRKHSEESKRKISDSKKGITHKGRTIRDSLTGKIYSTTKECCEENDLCFSRFREYVETNYKGYGRYEYI